MTEIEIPVLTKIVAMHQIPKKLIFQIPYLLFPQNCPKYNRTQARHLVMLSVIYQILSGKTKYLKFWYWLCQECYIEKQALCAIQYTVVS